MSRSPESFVAGLVSDLELKRLQGKPEATRRKLKTLVEESGWEKRSPERLKALIGSLGDAGLFADPDISDIHLPLATYISFSREPRTPVGRTIHPERALGFVLSKYPDRLEAVLSDLGKLKLHSGGAKPERTFYLDDQSVKPDLVFTSSSKRWLVCELEAREPKGDSIDALVRYIEVISRLGKPVTGLLVTGTPTTNGQRRHIERKVGSLRERGVDARWVTYDVDVVLTFASGEDSSTATRM